MALFHCQVRNLAELYQCSCHQLTIKAATGLELLIFVKVLARKDGFNGFSMDSLKYCMLVLNFSLQMGKGSRNVFVIDEIGKMELFSHTFTSAVRQALDSSACTILGTIPVPKGKPVALLEEIRAKKDVKVFVVCIYQA